MKSLCRFFLFVSLICFSPHIQAESRPGARPSSAKPVEKPSSERAREDKRNFDKGIDEHGRKCEGPCKAISSGRGNEGQVSRGKENSEGDRAAVFQDSVRTVAEKDREAVRKTLEAQRTETTDPNALKGLVTRERLGIEARKPSSAEAKNEVRKRGADGFFLTKLVERLKGMSFKEQLDTLMRLVCTSQCGHNGMRGSCRAVSQLLRAVLANPQLIPAGAAAISGFMISEVEGQDGSPKLDVEVSFEGTDKTWKSVLDNKEQPEEQVRANKDSE